MAPGGAGPEAPPAETGGSAKVPFCFMNQGFSVIGMETRVPRAGEQNVHEPPGLPQLSGRGGVFLLGKQDQRGQEMS